MGSRALMQVGLLMTIALGLGCDAEAQDPSTICFELVSEPASGVCPQRECLGATETVDLGSHSSVFDDDGPWTSASAPIGEGRISMDREVYDAIKALAVGESLPAESGATASFPMSASPNAHESWSSISAAVEVTRMDGGFEFRGSTQGGSAPTLTLSYCDEWCASGDFCECYCDYEASAAPSYEVMGRVDQAWPD